MASLKIGGWWLLILWSVVVASLSQGKESVHEFQEGSHISQETQERIRRQVPQATWVSCDFTSPSKVACHDCNTRVICKPFGGILKPCNSLKPYCNNGGCSAVPSAQCA